MWPTNVKSFTNYQLIVSTSVLHETRFVLNSGFVDRNAKVGAGRIPGSFGVSDGEDGSGVVAFWLKRRLSRTVHRCLAELHYARAAAVQLPHHMAAGPGVPGDVWGPAAAPSDGGSDDGSGDGPQYTADQLLDFESEASAIAAEFLAQF